MPTLLLRGETGTGKGLTARAIHDSGPRAQGPFVTINCAAIPETLCEAELFGYEAGAFTDARRAKAGLFEAASGGTLFLDEIDALALALQPKLLTALEEKCVRRLGAVTPQAVDVKLIAATKEELRDLVATGRFRADLYHRLAVVVLELPPLRARGEDSVLLAQHCLQQYATAHGLRPKQLSAGARACLLTSAWPGNVRELQHLMERVTLLHTQDVIDVATLERLSLASAVSQPAPEAPAAPDEVVDEATRVQQALVQTGGNVVRAARLLGLSRGAMRYRMRRYGLVDLALLPHSASQGESRRAHPQGPITLAPSHRERAAQGSATWPAAWVQKPVAVLALSLTFPQPPSDEMIGYDPWTVAARWRHLIEEKVHSFGGLIVQHAPAPVIAVFGVPHTLEQMPQRAIQAGLAIRRLVTDAHTALRTAPCSVAQFAVHYGAVLIDTPASQPAHQVLAVGDTLTWPVCMLGHARDSELLVSSQVGPQVKDVCTLDEHALPWEGEATKRQVYTVRGLRAWQTPLAGRLLRQFVGRDRELAALHAYRAQAERGQGQMVGIVGEAGLGKSRLLAELCRSLAEQTVTYVEGHCLAYGSTLPYVPIVALLRQVCHLLDTDSPDIIRGTVQQLLRTLDMGAEEAAPYLLRLLGIQTDTEPLAGLTPEAIRGRTFAVLRQVILQSCLVRPLILVVENLHWIDATSEAFLAALVEHCAGAPLLFLATYRPGYRLPWINRSWVAQITLQPLAPHDSQRVVQGMTTDTQIPSAIVQQILTRAEGNPFFLEELTQAALEQRDTSQPLVIPDTIQGVLMARLDRLPEAPKHVLSTAAIIGRDVPRWLLDRLWEGPDTLDTHLRVLQQLEFLYEQVTSAAPTYRFKHALTRDVAYESLPLQRRHSLHAAAGQRLEEHYADRLEDAVAHLAYHYAHSTVSAKAVTYLTRQGDRAARGYAHTEAVTALQQALEHAECLPAGERARCRLDLILRLTFSLSVLGRFQECLSFMLSSQADFARLDEPALMSQYYFRLGITYNYLGEYTQGRQSAQRALEAAQRCGDTAIVGKAYYVSAMAAYMSGQFQPSAAYSQQAVACLEQTTERHYLGLAYYFVGISHGLMGNFPVACEALDRIEALGQTIGDARLQSFAAHSLGWINAMQGHWDMGIAACQRSLAYAPTPFDAAEARGFLGYAYLEQGDSHQAIPLLYAAVEYCRQAHFRPGLGRMAPLLGEAYLLHGDLARAQDASQ